jgi:uncharacterized surface protein with fasciclin (FAS1) repeats
VLAAGLAGALSATGPFTVFAPTDAAFAALPAGVLDAVLADPNGLLTQILLYHVSPQQIVGPGNTVLCTLNGAPLLASPTLVNNIQILSSCTTRKNNTTFNTINTVLIPFNATQCLVQ